MTDGDGPLYVRVQAAIRDAIREGRLPPGAPLPSEKDLETEHGVSRITVRRALDELEREGLILRGRGRQARVVEPLVSVARTEIEDDLADMLQLVRGTQPRVLSFGWTLPDQTIRTQLGIGPDEPALRVERVRSSHGHPVLHTRAHVPAWIGAKLDRGTMSERTMLENLQNAGVTIAHAEQIMQAAPCPAALADHLALTEGDPVFLIERLVRDDRERPIQHLLATFRWDSFSYRVSSTRSAAGRVVEMAGAGRVAPPAPA